MIDRLEEILKRAEPQAETEEENGLSSLGFLSVGAVLRVARAGDTAEQSGSAFEDEMAGPEETAAAQADARRLWAADRLPAPAGAAYLGPGVRSAEELPGLAGAGLNRAAADSGLRMLYRRVGEAVRGAAAPGAAPSGITVVQEGAGITVGLTAEELDRAVRRDSRRYDGGMSIY